MLKKKVFDDFITEMVPSKLKKTNKPGSTGQEKLLDCPMKLPQPPEKVPLASTTLPQASSPAPETDDAVDNLPTVSQLLGDSKSLFSCDPRSRSSSRSKSRSISPSQRSVSPSILQGHTSLGKKSYLDRLRLNRPMSDILQPSVSSTPYRSRSRSRGRSSYSRSRSLSRSERHRKSSSTDLRYRRERSRSSSQASISTSSHRCGSQRLNDWSYRRDRRRSRSRSIDGVYGNQRSRSKSHVPGVSQSSNERPFRRDHQRSKSRSSDRKFRRDRSGSRSKSQRSKDRSYRVEGMKKGSSGKSARPSSMMAKKQKSDTVMEEDAGFPMSEGNFQKRVLHLLMDIRKELQAQRKVQQLSGDFTITRADTLDEFLQLESSSKKPEERKAMIDFLSKVGGANLRDNIKRIMEKLMTNEIMAQFNMKGNKNKMAFRYTSLMSVVIASALKTVCNKSCSEQEASAAVAHCLKYAPDRRGGGGRKAGPQQAVGQEHPDGDE